MPRLHIGLLIAASLCLGSQIPRGWIAQVGAAPRDVQGSPNISVDTYKNSKGSFVLFSDGRIISAKGGSADLGHPYSDPETRHSLAKAEDVRERAKGSPHVAVKALVRSDGTFVLFADGSIKKPANSDAAAGGSDGKKIVSGVPTYGGDPTAASHGASSEGDGWRGDQAHVTFDPPFTKVPVVTLQPIYDPSASGGSGTNVALVSVLQPRNVSVNGFDVTIPPGQLGRTQTITIPSSSVSLNIHTPKYIQFVAVGE